MATGFRSFDVAYGDGEAFLLPSTTHAAGRTSLEYPTVEAVCNRNRSDHRAPQPNCTCGYHAYYDASGAVEYTSYNGTGIMADVWGYGRVMNHEAGFRSRFLQVTGFYHPFCRCKNPATLAQGQPRIGETSNLGAWTKRMTFYCEGCAPRARGQQTGLDGLMPIGVLLEALSAKFEAPVYGIEESRKVQDGFGSWNTQTDAKLREGEAKRQAEAERLRRMKREAEARQAVIERQRWEGKHAQPGLI